MTAKYRIKLKTGRVVGPFVIKQIGELYLKNHISGEELAQEFPVGDWIPLQQHKEIKNILTKIVNEDLEVSDLQNTKTHTMAKLSAAQKAKREKETFDNHSTDSKKEVDFKEFKFGNVEGPKVDYVALERKYKKRIQQEEQEQREKDEKEKEDQKKVEATRIIKRPYAKMVDKTVILERKDLDNVQIENEPESHDNSTDEIKDEEELPESIEEISTDEKTEFFNLNSAMAGLKVEAKVAEDEFEKQSLQENRDSLQVSSDLSEEDEDDSEDEDESASKKRARPITIAIVVGLLIFMFMPGEKKSVDFEPEPLDVTFPVAKKYKDEVKSESEFEKGEVDFAKNTYSSRLEAKDHYIKSLEFKFKDNPAMSRLLYIYAYDYKNVSEQLRADKNIFRLVKLNSSKVLTDPDVALATSLFYFRNKKDLTALKTIENYLRLSKPTEKIYATYVDILMRNGKYDQARSVLDNLEPLKNKSISSYLAIANYYQIDQRFDESLKVLDEGLQNYKLSVPLLIKKASVLLSKENYKELSAILVQIKNQQAEDSPYYYSRYLEYSGIVSAVQGDHTKATELFNKALSYYESDELRSLLSQADLKGEAASRSLILESKVIELMGTAKEKFRQRKWNISLSLAIEAADIMPNYIPAQLLLVEIQTNRGFFESALKNLERLRKEFPINTNINYALIKTYLMSHRIEDAERELAILGNTKFSQTSEYAMALATYYQKIENLRLSIKFYTQAIDLNPLQDENYYKLAKIFLKYKRFDRSKEMILDALSLDPTNVYYHSIYASILYETQTSDAAIGYLRGVLEKNNDHPKILGDIAIYYYRLGKINEFNEYKKRIENLNIRDKSFYEFLVESSRLRGEETAVVNYSRELIKVNPGDLEVRMELGQYLLKKGYYMDALDEFNEVVGRLETYPKANYFIARCYIVQEEYEKAIEYADKEIKANESLDSGHYIKGEILRLQGDYQESVKMLEKAISINGDSVEALLALGWIKMRQNYLDTARELYLRALDRDASVPEIHLQLGHIYRSSGQGNLAVESYENYLKLYPDAPNKGQIQGLIQRIR
jgi:tetratricopeptide (TPR) repeat protein